MLAPDGQHSPGCPSLPSCPANDDHGLKTGSPEAPGGRGGMEGTVGKPEVPVAGTLGG